MIKASELQDKLIGFEYQWEGYSGTSYTSTVHGLIHFWHDRFDYEVPGVGRVEKIEDFGGEGEGDRAWFVLRVTDQDGNVQYFRADGSYASYDGADFDYTSLYEVKPKQKTVTVYE